MTWISSKREITMADETSASAPTPAPASVVAASSPDTSAPAASVATTPAATTTVTTTETPAVTSPAAVTETPLAPTVLGTEPVKVEAPIIDASKPPVEVKPVDAVKPTDTTPEVKPETVADPKVESSQTVDPAPLPTYEPFTLPEGIVLDDGKLGEFTKKLGEFEVSSKVDHAVLQKFAQELVDSHIADSKEIGQRLAENYSKAWEKQTNDWFEAFTKDPEIGDKKFETTKKSVLDAVGKFAGDETQLGEFKKFMNDTGVGNHPSLIRLINNMHTKINNMQEKYETEKGVKPLAGTKPVADKKGFLQTMYGNLK